RRTTARREPRAAPAPAPARHRQGRALAGERRLVLGAELLRAIELGVVGLEVAQAVARPLPLEAEEHLERAIADGPRRLSHELLEDRKLELERRALAIGRERGEGRERLVERQGRRVVALAALPGEELLPARIDALAGDDRPARGSLVLGLARKAHER